MFNRENIVSLLRETIAPGLLTKSKLEKAIEILDDNASHIKKHSTSKNTTINLL